MQSLTAAAKTGNRREILESLRDKLAYTIENTDSGRDVAALSRRLMDVIAELDALPDADDSPNPLQKARMDYGS